MLTRLPSILGVVALLLGAVSAPSVRAANSRLPAQALALPRSAFPAGASVQGGPAADALANRMARFHTQRLAGRLGGYVQNASWWSASGQRISLRYLASIFGTDEQAAAAYQDVRATLWELGRPVGPGGSLPTYTVDERDGYVDAVAVLRDGPIQSELTLQYSPYAGGGSIQAALAVLKQAARLAARASRLAAAALPPPGPAAALPPIFVAPWGTGPVVKSPSLMVLDDTLVSPWTQLDQGSFRQPARNLPATQHHAILIPAGSLARYVRTASAEDGGWYDSAALYASPSAAEQALARLDVAERNAHWLQPYRLPIYQQTAGRLALTSGLRAWRRPGETVLAFRVANVVMLLATSRLRTIDISLLAARLTATAPSWLHTQGTQVVDAAGDPVRMVGLNWYGMDQQDFVVGGLDYQPYQAILQAIKGLGYNTLRLPYSNQLVEQNPVISQHLAANPQLVGLHALDIMDRIVNYAGALGLSVILDDHRSEAGWSAEENGLWYTADYPDAAFVHDWQLLAQRYAVNDAVVGADLRNEPHGPASWGDGNVATDWRAAAQRAGDAVLASNPHLLIVVEGVQFYGSANGWWGGNLMGVATAPVDLRFADGSSAHSQLVYSAHDYGPDLCGSGCPWFNNTTTEASLDQTWEQFWGYIVDDPAKPYAAPVWVGEFGTCNYQASCVYDTAPGSQGQWFDALTHYLAAKQVGWAYWSANGTQSTAGVRVYGAGEWYGLFDQRWAAPHDLLQRALSSIESGTGESGQVHGPS